MMLFEEFFRKKKISLAALQQGNPELYSEFELHYAQMGENSFDHTKKFWFNNLRHLYPLPPEVKAEKLRAENQVAEQTVTDTLTEPSPSNEAPKSGFKPRFKAGAAPKPVEGTPASGEVPAAEASGETLQTPPAPKLGFKPKFKTPAKATEPEKQSENLSDNPPVAKPDKVAETPSPKPAFKPRFQARNIPPKPEGTEPGKEEAATTSVEIVAAPAETEQTAPIPPPAAAAAESAAPKPGFKPRFKAVTGSKPATAHTADQPAAQEPEKTVPEIEEPQPEPEKAEEAPVDKPAYKPRFNSRMVKPKPPEENE